MLEDFKPVLWILLRFLLIYLILLGGYQYYLHFFEGTGLDPFSTWVGEQVVKLQSWLGYPSWFVPSRKYDATYFYVSGDYRTMMVEGCNSVSIMILFLAFVFAFYKGLKTFAFTGIGLLMLHGMNVLRIAGLNILMVERPEYTKMGHDYLFPAVIYGTVVVLWLVWVKFFALKSNETRR
ncbi:exosortase family protein XrtF [Bergeyella sp. RCAD1439]|uniref:exosortase family protein XrtF n=1 Tax=Bergeyella anatis TaxID=3113737 RepID=UPI002E19C7EA|nr:exosortase family protein XrtF [Bergeyella sp. RCAD1439]